MNNDTQKNLEFDRNQAAMLAIRLAGIVKGEYFTYGIRDVPGKPEMVELVLNLPGEGQAMWLMPRAQLVGDWPQYPEGSDKHNVDTRAVRINNFLRLFG